MPVFTTAGLCYNPHLMTNRAASLRRLGTGLSARLLVLTICFVLLAEVLIFVPSIARFRVTYLEERLASAHLAVLALEATPDQAVSAEQENELLAHVGAVSVALRKPGAGKLMLMRTPPTSVDATYDLREAGPVALVRDAFVSLTIPHNRLLRIVGNSPQNPEATVELVMHERPLCDALFDFAQRILALSLVISFFTAALVYFSLHRILVRPMRRLTESMTRFREDPEDVGNRIRPSARTDEIGVAETELASMQETVAAALHQKTRLAALGIAVTKINHDLKNILSTARLISERLTTSDDPDVRRMAPTLEKTIDRAVNLCVQTLNFTREGPPQLTLSEVDLGELLDDVGASLPAAQGDGGAWCNHVPRGEVIEADREQLYRVFANLGQNAIEAGAARVDIAAEPAAGALRIWVADDGPGLPPRAKDNLFQPFAGTVKRGGTGLGLAIARDLVRAHGGDLRLDETTAEGTRFRIELPLRQSGGGRRETPAQRQAAE